MPLIFDATFMPCHLLLFSAATFAIATNISFEAAIHVYAYDDAAAVTRVRAMR